MDAGCEKGLVGVDVADSGQHRLIEKQPLHSGPASSKAFCEFLGRALQRFGSEASEKAPGLQIVLPVYSPKSEPSRIFEDHPVCAIKITDQMRMLGQGLPRTCDPDPAGHFEMKGQTVAPVQMDEEEFGPARDVSDDPVRQ